VPVEMHQNIRPLHCYHHQEYANYSFGLFHLQELNKPYGEKICLKLKRFLIFKK
jgi:hypothetical protein